MRHSMSDSVQVKRDKLADICVQEWNSAFETAKEKDINPVEFLLQYLHTRVVVNEHNFQQLVHELRQPSASEDTNSGGESGTQTEKE